MAVEPTAALLRRVRAAADDLEPVMSRKLACLSALGCGALVSWLPLMPALTATQGPRQSIAIDSDDIGGVVTGTNGAEAGVWVIAETTDLPTVFRRIVVTDDAGRYVVPDLPKAEYRIWVRGYGLVDSRPVQSLPGKILDINPAAPPN